MALETTSQTSSEARNLQDAGPRADSTNESRATFLDVTDEVTQEEAMKVFNDNVAAINNLVTKHGKYRLNSGVPFWAAAIAIRNALERLDEVQNGMVLLEKK